MGSMANWIRFSPDGLSLIVGCGPASGTVEEIRRLRAPTLEHIQLNEALGSEER